MQNDNACRTMSTVAALYAGKIGRPFPGSSLKSAFAKEPISTLDDRQPIRVMKDGFESDEQGHSEHGGPDRALNHFPARNFSEINVKYRKEVENDVPDKFDETFQPCGLGENISTDDDVMNETTVCIGDVYQLGSAKLEVSQPRFPCPKINMRHGIKQKGLDSLQKYVLRNGRSGWFYRVIEEGEIKAGDQFLLLERKHSKWTVQRVQTTVYGNPLPYGTMEPEVTGERRQELQELLQMEELTYRSWKDSIAKMLEGTFKWR